MRNEMRGVIKVRYLPSMYMPYSEIFPLFSSLLCRVSHFIELVLNYGRCLNCCQLKWWHTYVRHARISSADFSMPVHMLLNLPQANVILKKKSCSRSRKLGGGRLYIMFIIAFRIWSSQVFSAMQAEAGEVRIFFIYSTEQQIRLGTWNGPCNFFPICKPRPGLAETIFLHKLKRPEKGIQRECRM